MLTFRNGLDVLEVALPHPRQLRRQVRGTATCEDERAQVYLPNTPVVDELQNCWRRHREEGNAEPVRDMSVRCSGQRKSSGTKCSLGYQVQDKIGVPSRDDDRCHYREDGADAPVMQAVSVIHGQESERDQWMCLARGQMHMNE